MVLRGAETGPAWKGGKEHEKAHLFRDAPIDLPEQPKLVEILSQIGSS